jgi:hypothetical protein
MQGLRFDDSRETTQVCKVAASWASQCGQNATFARRVANGISITRSPDQKAIMSSLVSVI